MYAPPTWGAPFLSASIVELTAKVGVGERLVLVAVALVELVLELDPLGAGVRGGGRENMGGRAWRNEERRRETAGDGGRRREVSGDAHTWRRRAWRNEERFSMTMSTPRLRMIQTAKRSISTKPAVTRGGEHTRGM